MIKAEKTEKGYLKDMEVRGSSASIKAEADLKVAEQANMSNMKNIMVNGRKELQKQRLYKCKRNSIEFEIKFTTDRISDIRDELTECREDGKDVDDAEIKRLKSELNILRKLKGKLF